jgi:hypothetical protein
MALAFGYGSIWSADRNALMPLILLNAERLSDFPFPRMERFEPLPIELLELFRGLDSLRLPKLPLPLYFLPSSRPRPSGFAEELFDEVLSVQDPIMCAATRERGTAGVSVFDLRDGTRALLTVGHVFPNGAGSRALRLSRRLLFFRRATPLGVVTHQVVPQGLKPGWDAAVIKVDDSIPTRAAVVKNHWRRFERQEPVVAYGARSGVVKNAQTQGGLETFSGDDAEWKNCWITAPTGMLRPGDSGAAVFTRSNRSFLGLYVGRGKVGGVVTAHYVQDSYTLEQEVLAPWGLRF